MVSFDRLPHKPSFHSSFSEKFFSFSLSPHTISKAFEKNWKRENGACTTKPLVLKDETEAPKSVEEASAVAESTKAEEADSVEE